jgi:hypothetical protein
LLRAILQVALTPVHRFPQVSLINDVVAIKNGPRFVPTDRLGDSLRDISADHIANGCPAKIVEYAPGVPSLVAAFLTSMPLRNLIAAVTHKLPAARRNTGRRPCLAKITYPMPLGNSKENVGLMKGLSACL